jgi:hypothetical protein
MTLPRTGTNALLELLSPYIPDEAIADALPRHQGSGRRAEWSAGQLYRVLLLLLLTPARSTNLLCALLPEQRAWRRFAHLPNQRCLPNIRQLHEFRRRLTPGVLRNLNALLLQRVLATWPQEQVGIGLIDATDLPAAAQDRKKSPPESTLPARRPSVAAPRRSARRATSSVTRSTLCGSGWHTTKRPFCSCR